MSAAKVDELASVALATAAMLLTEILLGGFANYLYSDRFGFFLPMVVFGGLAVGSVAGLTKLAARARLSTLLVLVGAVTLLSLVGLARVRMLGALWVALPIAAFGIYLCRAMSEIRLSTMVWALSLGGTILYVSINELVPRLGQAMGSVLVALVALAAIAARRTPFVLGSGVVLVAGSMMLGRLGVFDVPSYLELTLPGLVGAEHVDEPVFTPLVRTDILRLPDRRLVLTTNGSRFAMLPTPARKETVLADGRSAYITYEAPYLAVAPKNVLVIGAAEGWNVLTALAHGATSVVAVDINPAVFSILRRPAIKAEAGTVYDDPRVETVVSEGRRYVETSARKFDLITLQGVQTGSHNDFLNTALLESFLHTDDAIQAMWRALTPEGAVYFDEYAKRQDSDRRDVTFVSLIAGSAVRALALDAKRQCVHYYYRQAPENPHGQLREAFILTKQPLSDATLETVRSGVDAMGGTMSGAACRLDPPPSSRIVDDRPFFMQTDIVTYIERGPLALLGAVAVVALGYAVFRRSRKSRRRSKVPALPMTLTGIGYIVFVLAITGPATLLLGDPQLTTPVVFFGMYFWGLAGGLVGLRVDARRLLVAVSALAVYLLGLSFAVPLLEPLVLPIASTTGRALIVGALLLPAAFLAELPYVHLLNRVEGGDRGRAYVWENVGTLLGLPIAFSTQALYGARAAFIVSAVFYALALLAAARLGDADAVHST